MPPRKRTAAKPEATEDQQTAEGLEAEEPAPGDSADTNDQPDNSDTPPESAVEEDSPGPKEPDGPAKSDLKTADQPCTECMPNGWPEGAFSVGCTHGTWVRETK
ncbi:hypothetical protein OIU81_02825 [Streptomyces sp. NBC_01454]|uniref:hypothetical protein n=1 Tax=Streptomyces sp. NBC_01454 TaxID=2975867 RepID=UPI002E3818A0|nr:hypothetical protein [Streptomyces sp. NBC_01454]